MGKNVNPGVDESEDPELAGPELIDPLPGDNGEVTPDDTPEADDEQEQPTAGTEEATARRSRRADTKETGKATNLDDLPEFRKYKSERDRDLDALRKRLAETERREAEREAAFQQQQLAQFTASLDNYDDPEQKKQAILQIAATLGHSDFKKWRAWDNHVREEATKAGLDPADFESGQYVGEQGALQFERDLANAKAAKLERERKELAERASPASIAKIVKEELAKLRQAQGLDDVDTGESAAPASDNDQLHRDMRALNSGKMSPQEFRKRHG